MSASGSAEREFDLSDVLSVTTGLLLSRRHIDGLYDVLGYMTGESLMTHQLPRAEDACQPVLLHRYPHLSLGALNPPTETWARIEDKDRVGEAVWSWVDSLRPLHGDSLPVPRIEFVHKNPLTELLDMAGDKPVFVIGPSA